MLPFISLECKFTLSRLTFYLIVDCCTIPQEFRRILAAFENRKIADLSLVILSESVEKLSFTYRITKLVKPLLCKMHYRCPNPDPSPAVCGSFLIGFACWDTFCQGGNLENRRMGRTVPKVVIRTGRASCLKVNVPFLP